MAPIPDRPLPREPFQIGSWAPLYAVLAMGVTMILVILAVIVCR